MATDRCRGTDEIRQRFGGAAADPFGGDIHFPEAAGEFHGLGEVRLIGLVRRPRIRVIRNGWPVIIAKDKAVRNICPPPSVPSS